MKNNNIKILQVIDTLNIGGGERVFVDMCNILSEKNENIEVLFLLKPGKLSNDLDKKIVINSLNRKNKWSFSKMHECSLLLKQNDIIHCHFRHVFKYIKLVAILFNVKAIIILHDHYGSIDIDKKVPFLFNSIFKPTIYIGVSDSLCTWARECLNLEDKKISKLQNVIIKSNEKKIDINGKDLVLVSNFKPVKNNKFALEIIEKSNLSLMMIGTNQDDNYFKKIKFKIQNSNLDVELNQSVNNIQPILNNFKIGLHTSVSESGPLVLIEYLAQELPFLAYDTGEVAKILKPHFPDYFIDNFNVVEWIKRIELLIKTPKNTELMKEVFDKNFSKIQYYKKLKFIYNE